MNWRNTIQAGPGAAQWILDDLELGPRVAVPWSSGKRWCATDRLHRYVAPPTGQLSLGFNDVG